MLCKLSFVSAKLSFCIEQMGVLWVLVKEKSRSKGSDQALLSPSKLYKAQRKRLRRRLNWLWASLVGRKRMWQNSRLEWASVNWVVLRNDIVPFLVETGNVRADTGRYLLSTLADPQSTMSERGNAASHFDKHQSQLPEELLHEIGNQQLPQKKINDSY